MKSLGSGWRSDPGWKQAEEVVQLAVFSVGDERYAIDIMRIKEIINPLRITRLPKAPPFVEGVIELRGVILPLIDMRRRFELPVTAPTRATKYLIVKLGRAGGAAALPASAVDWLLGLVVDGVQEVIRVPKRELRPAPVLAEGGAGCWSGVHHHRGQIVLIVDLDRLFSPFERASLDRMSAETPGPGSAERPA